MNDQVLIGKILKHLMAERSLTFKKLSELSGVPASTIKTWSSGIEPKSMTATRKVARALGVSVEYLVFGTTDKQLVSLDQIITNQLFSGWCKVTIELPVSSPILAERKDVKS